MLTKQRSQQEHATKAENARCGDGTHINEEDNNDSVQGNSEKVHDCGSRLLGDVSASHCAERWPEDSDGDFKDQERQEDQKRIRKEDRNSEGGSTRQENETHEKLWFGLIHERSKEGTAQHHAHHKRRKDPPVRQCHAPMWIECRCPHKHKGEHCSFEQRLDQPEHHNLAIGYQSVPCVAES